MFAENIQQNITRRDFCPASENALLPLCEKELKMYPFIIELLEIKI